MTEIERSNYRKEELQQEQEDDLRMKDILEYKEYNETELINGFIEKNKKDFETFLKNEIINEIYNIDYWKRAFCEDEEEYAFEEYYIKCYKVI